jgi:phosphoribosylglycinamide formyltransferase-1
MVNVAIFVSGSGTNCENIINYFKGSEDVNIALVLSNRADAYALVRAKILNVPTVVVPRDNFKKHDGLMPVMERYSIDFIVLAGFLLMVPDFLINAYPQRIVNIHPALLPKYGGKGMYGHYIHEAVKAAGEKETGITIHYVSEKCDGGEVIFQAKTALSSYDNVEDIAAKIHLLEQRCYPEIIENVIKEQF